MAVSAVAGLASVGGAWAAAGFTALSFATVAGSFAIGAGLSALSRALAPKPSLGLGMEGLETNVKEPAGSRKIIYGRARIGGNIVFIDQTGEDNKYLHLVIAVAGHHIDQFEEIYFNDELVWNGDGTENGQGGSYVGDWATYARIKPKNGQQTVADDELVAESTYWTTNHILNNTAYIYVRLAWDQEKFANGIPNISAVIKGKRVYDPRTSTTAWSDNPALCIRDYLLDTKYGLGEDSARIDTTALNASATDCDTAIDLAAGGTQTKYTINGVIDTASSIRDNVEAMLASMGGQVVYSGGKYYIRSARWVTPVMTIDETMAVGALQVQTKRSRRETYNAVKGVFLNEDDNYILTDYPAQISSTYAVQDGDPIYLDMPLPFVTNQVRAQRIAKIVLLKSRQQTTVTIPLNLAALKFKAGDNIQISNTRLGWASKNFEVQGYSVSFDSGGSIVVNVTAIETDSAVYDWLSSDEQDFLSGSEVSIYDGTPVAPTTLVVTETTALTDDGGVIPAFDVTWVAPSEAFIDHYEVQYKLTSATLWNSLLVNESNANFTGITIGSEYTVRVRSINYLGRRSAWLTGTLTAEGDTTAPATPTNLAASGGQNTVTLTWDNPTDSDFKEVVVERSLDGSTGWTAIGKSPSESYVDPDRGYEQTYYYRVKSVDRSGNASAATSAVSVTTAAQISDGTSYGVIAIYAENTSGLNATFTYSGQSYVNFYQWSGSPPTTVPSGLTYSLFVGSSGSDGDEYQTATGYLYYQSAGDPGASVPTYNTNPYNFSTGTFTTTNPTVWKETPPTMNGDNSYYYLKFSVYSINGGTQTISFTSAFEGYNFNGLVSFTSLSTPGQTTIDGGNIETGTITGITFQTAASGERIAMSNTNQLRIYNGNGTVIGSLKGTAGGGGAALSLTGAASDDISISITHTSTGTPIAISQTGSTTAGTACIDTTMSGGGEAAYFKNTGTGRGLRVAKSGTSGVGAEITQSANALALYVKNSEGTGASLAHAARFEHSGVTTKTLLCSAAGHGMLIESSYGNGIDASASLITGSYAIYCGSKSVYASGTVLSFTGGHDVLVEKTFSGAVGDIVVDQTLVYAKGVSETLFAVTPSSTAQAKTVLGVLSRAPVALTDDTMPSMFAASIDFIDGVKTITYEAEYDGIPALYDVAAVNALGEGQINVCGENGDISAGDYICSSSMAGKGMKQADDILHSYTVAKARESVTFSSPTEVKMIACTYHCG